jgi:hypothetical protein
MMALMADFTANPAIATDAKISVAAAEDSVVAEEIGTNFTPPLS